MRRAALILIGALIGASPAWATPRQDRGQSSAVDVGTPVVAKTIEAPPQISASADADATAATQLTATRGTDDATPQLTSGARTAEAPQGLSKPAEGRTADVERVAGKDRCDPGDERNVAAECRNVIESRSADYGRRAPAELSPEQRLLIAQKWGPNAPDAAAARLAKSGAPEEDVAGLGIAAIVLQQSAPAKADDQKPAAEDPTANAAVQAVIQVLTQGTQN